MTGQELAKYWAQKVGTPLNVMLATVKSETNFNNSIGDNGNALGYGQVWAKKWHYTDLQYASKLTGVAIPAQSAPIEEFQKVIKANPNLSMALAAKTIKDFWEGSGGDWDKFTKMYVGPNIPTADLERRRKHWIEYSGSSAQSLSNYVSEGDITVLNSGDNPMVILAGVAAVLWLIKD